MAEEVPNFYAISLDLRGKRCVVVGGGTVAARKIGRLLECDADVWVISPEVCDAVQTHIQSGTVTYFNKVYEESDIRGAFLVIAATNQRDVNHQVFLDCEETRTLVNVIDECIECSFIVPATVRRGPLQVAVSTSGTSPSQAKKLREALEDDLDHGTHRFTEAARSFVPTGRN